MDENNKYVVADLIQAAVDQKPLDFENAFGALMVDKLRTAVENKKQEIAQNMFAQPDSGVEEPEVSAEEPEVVTNEEPE